MLTQAALREILRYNPDTGIFTWIISVGRIGSGSIAGTPDRHGYIKIGINHKIYGAHRLAWLYLNGEFPADEIDHINGIRDDNRSDNLRSVTAYVNNRNKKMPSHNTSGCIGVSCRKGKGCWNAYISNNRKRYNLGYYKDWFEAVCVRKAAEVKYGFHINHGRRQD